MTLLETLTGSSSSTYLRLQEVSYGTRKYTNSGRITKTESSFTASKSKDALRDSLSPMKRRQRSSSKRWPSEKSTQVKLQRHSRLAELLLPLTSMVYSEQSVACSVTVTRQTQLQRHRSHHLPSHQEHTYRLLCRIASLFLAEQTVPLSQNTPNWMR